jgi:hypothetical protein
LRIHSPHQTLYSLIHALLLTPVPRAVEAPKVPVSPHEFIDALHRPRIYKTYLQEASDICRDYFWILCHTVALLIQDSGITVHSNSHVG